MKPKFAIIAAFILAVGIILFFTLRGGKNQGTAGPSKPGTGQTGPAGQAPEVEITFLYSTEKKEWIEAAIAAFQRDNPTIKVTATGRGSLEAVNEILEGKQKPMIWSPADTLAVNLLASDWETKYGERIFAESGEDAPQPLVITPLVFVIWEDRAQALLSSSNGQISWKTIHKAVSSNQGWPAVGGKPAWGFVKLGHTDPTRSNSGLQTLLLMTLEYFGKTAGLEIADVLKPEYQTWIKEVEKGVAKFEHSTGTFMTEMIRFGPSKYDIAVVYENLAISQLENAQGRWGNLKVYYPAVTLWSDHPAAPIARNMANQGQQAAARKFLAYLRSRPVQEQALTYGFRPADPAVPIRTADARNPFTRLAEHGIQIEIPPVATLPEGPVIRNLQMMWSRVVGR